jgi:hypothetical protein
MPLPRRTLKIPKREMIWARKLLGRKKSLRKYATNAVIAEWGVRFPGGYSVRLTLRNEEDRPHLYYSLIRGINGEAELLCEVQDHMRIFGGEYPLYTEDDVEYRLRVCAKEEGTR